MSYLTTLEITAPTGNLTQVMKNERDWITARRHVSQHREHPQQLSKTKTWSNTVLGPHIRFEVLLLLVEHLRTRTAASRELSSRGKWQMTAGLIQNGWAAEGLPPELRFVADTVKIIQDSRGSRTSHIVSLCRAQTPLRKLVTWRRTK